MNDFHGIIFAYLAAPGLGELTRRRTSASLPLAGRYRIIDFTLSSLVNAGVRDAGVIMQRDYQSLLDHLGSGKDWDMSRRSGGLRPLPPFGLPESHWGEYRGTMEAMSAMSSYVHNIKQEHLVMLKGDLVANIDLRHAMKLHIDNKADVTAVCTNSDPAGPHHRFVAGDDGFAADLLTNRQGGSGKGLASLEAYLIRKELILDMISYCAAANKLHFHRDALMHYMYQGSRVQVYVHEGYAALINTVRDYYNVSMDILGTRCQAELFPEERPLRTKERADVSTYYGPSAKARNCLVADGCYIDGSVENCILSRGVRIKEGASLKNCIIMQDTEVCEGAALSYVISDKDVSIAPGTTLAGNSALPLTIPKGSIV